MSVNNLANGVFVSGNGPAIIFLHSSLSSSRQWFELTKVLEENFTCINIDLLGYGNAYPVNEKQQYSFDVELARIEKAIQQVSLDKKYHVVGHSCGGAIALKLAQQSPDKLLSLTLYEPVAFHLFSKGSDDRKVSDEFAAQVLTQDNVTAATTFTDFWNRPGFFQSLPSKVQQSMAADMDKVNLDFKALVAESYTTENIAEIVCPCLFMVGKHSPELSHNLAEIIINALPNVTVEHIASGHMAPISHAKLVLPKIETFISTHS